MRIILFYGLICIVEAVGKMSGWGPSPFEVKLGAGLLGYAIIADVVDFVKVAKNL